MEDGSVRKMREEWEKQMLSPYATLAVNTRGREIPMPLCPVRTECVRDRDRSLHSKSFRRLKHKTQVFLAPKGDHYRTRLTHTLEVTQIARTISRALRLNEDLTEAIAMGHDLGHTPFGHAGEEVLNALLPGGFKHNQQSLRVVEKLEYDGKGLNLTWEVRDGIVCHTRGKEASTLEGRIVKLSDRIAYINHDIDDAMRAGVLTEEDLPRSCIELFGETHGKRINSLIINVIQNSFESDVIRFSPDYAEEFKVLRKFMFDRVYLNPTAKSEEGKAKGVVRALYEYYCEHPELLDEEFAVTRDTEGTERAVADFIAGMSDTYAIETYEKIFVPKSWS